MAERPGLVIFAFVPKPETTNLQTQRTQSFRFGDCVCGVQMIFRTIIFHRSESLPSNHTET